MKPLFWNYVVPFLIKGNTFCRHYPMFIHSPSTGKEGIVIDKSKGYIMAHSLDKGGLVLLRLLHPCSVTCFTFLPETIYQELLTIHGLTCSFNYIMSIITMFLSE